MSVNIGRMDRRIELQSLTSSQDDAGEQVKTWATFAAVWANVKQTSGRELVTGDQQTSENIKIFFIRWWPGVTELDRISYNNRLFDIFTIKEIGRREGLEITAKVVGLD